MSKKFEEWYESEWKRLKYSHEKNDALLGWKACKEQILNILNQQSIENMGEIEVAILLDKIKNL